MGIRAEFKHIAEHCSKFKRKTQKEPEKNPIENLATFEDFVEKALEIKPDAVCAQTRYARTDGASIVGLKLDIPSDDCIITEYEIPSGKTETSYLYTEMYVDDKGNPITLRKMDIVESALFIGSCELTAMERLEALETELDRATGDTKPNIYYTGAHYSCPTAVNAITKERLKRIVSCNGKSQPHSNAIPARFDINPWRIKI
jgi:hypothetical protein